jgi:exodeoxyribonuclease VII large subunit
LARLPIADVGRPNHAQARTTMMLFPEESLSTQRTWTVTELTSYIRDLFEIDYRLQDIEVAGEISNFTEARSGHLYFTLKDRDAQLKCVMWRQSAQRLAFGPQDGDAVVARGRVTVYEAAGVYQLYVEQLVAEGRGDLALAFERLKQELSAEGLFEQAAKKPIPPIPRKIGIVTSADAAALRDILNVLRRRWPLVEVLIAPTLVQGREAPLQIIRALEWLDGRDDVDTIIVARGGGSIEDLWAFNDERVARAIFRARHPIIVGVGHETDYTIADFVADVRAPTPSAAAELSVPDQEEFLAFLREQRRRLAAEFTRSLSRDRQRLEGLVRAMSHLSPRRALDASRQRLDSQVDRLDQSVNIGLERRRARLAMLEARLGSVSPRATMARGYALVRRPDRQLVRSVMDVEAGDAIRVEVSDGSFGAVVTNQGRAGTGR